MLNEIFKFSRFILACLMLWSVNCNLANASTIIQCYWDYIDLYSAYDGSFYKRKSHNNKPRLRLTISDDEVLKYEDYVVCGRGNAGDPLHGWIDTVTSSKISLSCIQTKFEPEKRSGIKKTINIDRYTGELLIEEIGYSPNNDKMDYPFTFFQVFGRCEVAKPMF